MSETIARQRFTSTIDYTALPHEQLVALFRQTQTAHGNFFALWQQAVTDRFGAETCAELTTLVYPNLESCEGDLARVFYEELNFMWSIMENIQQLLTFAHYDPSLLPTRLGEDLALDSLSCEGLVLLWNTATLTYVMQTNRWTDLLTRRYSQAVALKVEKDVWLDYGGAEDDLRFGLEAAGALTGNVESLLRGFQFAPGEVGLVEAEFTLESPNHGFITHHRCPAKDRFAESNRERLENSCVLCVTAMRLSGEMVNPDIRCRAVDIPPYREDPGHACRWEYWLDVS